MKAESEYKEFKSLQIVKIILKTGDNLKQEQFALQLIFQFQQIFLQEKLNLKLTTYEVLSLGPDYGIIEMIQNATTIDNLKRITSNLYGLINLEQIFVKLFGKNINKARTNFCSSLAAYSLICYFLQVKDRHNRNIMLNKEGYIIHIDFGFFFSNSPGFNVYNHFYKFTYKFIFIFK